MGGDPEVSLAETFGEVARALLAEQDSHAILQTIVNLAVRTIDGCEHAGVSMVEQGKVTSPASSDPVPAVLDHIQSDTGEGPCVDAIKEHEVFETGHLSTEGRWPQFAHRAHTETEVESVLSFRLFANEATMGALNLYSTKADAFDDHDVAIGAVFATHAAVALSASRKIENLRLGMSTRQLIGEATGLLMAREGVSDAEAFDMLKRASQRLNLKLRDVAEQLVHPGPGSAPGTPAGRPPDQVTPVEPAPTRL